MNDSGQQTTRRNWLSVLLNLLVSVLVLAGSAFGVWVIYRTEPTAEQLDSKRKSSALVETVKVHRDTFSPQLSVLGTVEPVQDIVLSPRVRGQVIELSPSFVPGGRVSKGDMLLRIDPADFENTVSVRKSELEQVVAQWNIEEGRAKLAKQELELLGDSIGSINRSLVLREPQSASLKSQMNAAKAAIERAKLDLERTQLIAPFDAQVLRQSVNVGSQVGEGDDLGRLVGIDECWVIAALPVRNLKWVQFPKQEITGSKVTLRNSDAWGSGVEREGQVTRMIGALDQQTRLARVVVTVTDPLGVNSDVPPLILGSLIEVRIDGVEIEDVVRLERQYVHDGDTVWVMKDNELDIRKTEIAFRDAEFAYVKNGLDSGDEVVTTTLATVANGVQLRKVGQEEPTKEELTVEKAAEPETDNGKKTGGIISEQEITSVTSDGPSATEAAK